MGADILVAGAASNVRNSSAFGAEDFMAIASDYGSHIVPNGTKRKVQIAALVDMIGILDEAQTDELWTKALEVRAELRRMASEGSGYIPAKELGFGSDNSATLARQILGMSDTASAIRKKFKGLVK